jgi:[protein-PII] uridylyltransferase
MFSAGKITETFHHISTEIADQYLRRSLQESRAAQGLFMDKRPFAFVAVGGYGREELCLHSDLDILVLFSSDIPDLAKELAKETLFPLWDLGFDLGYSMRNIKDCLDLARNNFQVLTSLMDARFIGGESNLYLSMMETLQKEVLAPQAVSFNRWLEESDRIRMKKFGDASHLLEPNLKEGIGGLRSYHHILWLAKAFFHVSIPRDLEYLGKFSHDEYQVLENELKFIWLVRSHLHRLSKRKNDRLSFEYQKALARKLGFQNEKNVLAVEKFMGKIHASMASLKSLHRTFVHSHMPQKRKNAAGFQSLALSSEFHLDQGEINFKSATAILSNPFLLMEVFEQSSRHGCPLSMEGRRLVHEFLHLVDEAFRESEEASHSFLQIMNGDHTFQALEEMFDTGFLSAFIPEFSPIKDRVQFDVYHIFPVGRHSLETVRHLKGLPEQKPILLLDIFSDVSNPEPLFVAGLFHDIGKVGKKHARRGVAQARKILERIGYEKDRASDVLFLVGHHLLLVETATRRDLNDEKVIVQCARTVGNVERLKMLYLLTWADSKATGPGAWNEWIADIVQELFFKILHIFEKGELATPDASQKVEQTRSRVVHGMAGRMNQQELEGLFELMPARYLLNTPPSVILGHLLMFRQLKKRLKRTETCAFVLEPEEDRSGEYWEVSFLAEDRPGLFADIAGVMALNNVNILSADIFTWRDGTAVDIFRVTRPLDPLVPEKTWKKIKRDLKDTFRGTLSLTDRIDRKAAPPFVLFPRKPSRPPQVKVDNEASDFFTLIEVFSDDRVGLLYQITHTLFDLKLDIRVAKIATKSDQVADVFYVRDLEGQKIEDKERVEEIERTLFHELSQHG